MTQPHADRPQMPGYGIGDATMGTGLLPWAWAKERLMTSRNYWLATTWSDGRPQVTALWAVWHDDSLWLSCGGQSRKAKNLRHDPRCVITTEDATDPVVLEGSAEFVTDEASLAVFLVLVNHKYEMSFDLDFVDPERNATIRIRPNRVFGMLQEDFGGSPTRWTFDTD